MQVKTDEKLINELLNRGVENIYPSKEFLKEKLMSGKKLTLYLGIDPTGPTLHLGHAINLIKLKQFQDLGHQVIMLIGSFTAMIGDPTDKLAARKQLTKKQVLENCTNYKKQASKILDFSGKNKALIKYNDDWLGKLKFAEILDLASHLTVQRMLERDMFEKRMREGRPIHLHEFLYPLMQGYDCVAMDVDGEIGGNDQTFNMLVGRTMMKSLKNKEKFVLTNKLLTDPTGAKMGKTTGNMITMDDAADEMFGKIMSWPDEMIIDGYESLTLVPMPQVKTIEKKLGAGENPRDHKINLAFQVVKFFIGESEADRAKENFIKIFANKEKPEEIEEKSISAANIVAAMLETGLVKSKGEARRLIDQRGVKVNDQAVDSYDYELKDNDVIQKGRRFFVKVRI